jgi:hypothetical protein
MLSPSGLALPAPMDETVFMAGRRLERNPRLEVSDACPPSPALAPWLERKRLCPQARLHGGTKEPRWAETPRRARRGEFDAAKAVDPPPRSGLPVLLLVAPKVAETETARAGREAQRIRASILRLPLAIIAGLGRGFDCRYAD